MIASRKTLSAHVWRPVGLLLTGCTAFLLTGCIPHLEFPPMGEPLPYTVKLELTPAIKDQTLRYTDSCGQPEEIPVGRQIEEALRQGAARTFTAVAYGETTDNTIIPDHVVKIEFRDWAFDLDKDALYDRAPATLRMNAFVRIYDMRGTLLRETEFKVLRRERLRLERDARSCDYVIDPFIQDTAIELASKVFLDARIAFGEQPSPAPAAETPAAVPPSASSAVSPSAQATGPSAAATLKFKALLLDENSNLILEGGEHVRVRVDVVNTGSTPVQNAVATLTGTPAILGQFPATTLTIPPLQPGQTKSLEFVATLPPTSQPQQAEIHVSVTEPGGAASPAQILKLTIQPASTGSDDVDQIPAPTSSFQQPDTYLISIGVGAYRDPRIAPRAYASRDAGVVADYFQALGGVPPSNVRLLQDSKARRDDIDEVLFDWLPLHANANTVLIVYFAGQAMTAPTGEVSLALYDARLAASTPFYPLKDIESALAKLNVKQALFIFDGMVSELSGNAAAPAGAPRWDLAGGTMIRIIAGEKVTKGLEDERHRHGLLTYYLLRGLRGDADTNRDGSVTLGELSGYARQKVAWAAKSQFNAEQRPQIVPALKPDDKAAALVLSKRASLAGSDIP